MTKRASSEEIKAARPDSPQRRSGYAKAAPPFARWTATPFTLRARLQLEEGIAQLTTSEGWIRYLKMITLTQFEQHAPPRLGGPRPRHQRGQSDGLLPVVPGTRAPRRLRGGLPVPDDAAAVPRIQ